MKYFIFAYTIVFLVGCSILHSAKHDAKKLGKIHMRNPNVVANACSLYYPFTPIDTTETSYFKGESDTSEYENYGEDTKPVIQYRNDTITILYRDTVFRNKIVNHYDTVKTTHRETVLDTRSLAQKQGKIDSLNQLVSTQAKTIVRQTAVKRTFMWLFIGSLTAAGILAWLKIKSFTNPKKLLNV